MHLPACHRVRYNVDRLSENSPLSTRCSQSNLGVLKESGFWEGCRDLVPGTEISSEVRREHPPPRLPSSAPRITSHTRMCSGTIDSEVHPPAGRPTPPASIEKGVPKPSACNVPAISVRRARVQYSCSVVFGSSKSFSHKLTTAGKLPEIDLFCCIFPCNPPSRRFRPARRAQSRR